LDETEANKALAISIIEDVLMGQNPDNIINYIAEDYVQHNPGIDNGLVGIQAAVDYLISINNMFQYNTIHKVIGEGNFVLPLVKELGMALLMPFMICFEWKMVKP
jgi:predicted SnoaL-like aldol condensation-catalyzing enzyme